jgi:hypothetical protein
MKKLFTLSLLAALIFSLNGCAGSGGSSSTNIGDKTTVSINLGQTKSGSSGEKHMNEGIPPDVAKIVFTISASDMPTIIDDVPVSGRTSVTESFSIKSGNGRHFLAEARDNAGALLFSGSTTADLNGTPLALTIYMSAVDTAPPTVISTDPAPEATGVPVTTLITVTFSESVDPSSFGGAAFTLRTGATAVSGTLSVDGSVVTFTPGGGLAFDTTYTATIEKGVQDLAGNAMAADYSWSFVTGSAPDMTPPTVIAVSPAIGATDVSVASSVSATFSEGMDSSTINTDTFTLSAGNGNISGTVKYHGNTATFTPSHHLDYDTTYSAEIATGAKDLGGNSLASPFIWSFKTEGFIDLIVNAHLSQQGEVSSVDFSVRNGGTLSARDVVVFAIFESEGPYCESFLVPLMGPGSSQNFSVPYVYSPNYFIIADPFRTIPDVNRSNNDACGGAYCSNPPSLSICPPPGGGG